MQLKFIVDTQLPPVLSSFFVRKGIDSVHTTHHPQGQFMSDDEIRAIASKESRIIVTKDNDFFDSFFVSEKHPRVLFIQIGNIKNNDLVDLIDDRLTTIIEQFERGSRFISLSREDMVVY